MNHVCKAIDTAFANAASTLENNQTLYEKLCLMLEISADKGTSDAVFLRNQCESAMTAKPTKKELQTLELVSRIIKAYDADPDKVYTAKTITQLFNQLGEATSNSGTLYPLPHNFLEQAFHRCNTSTPSIFPAVYYKDGILFHESGIPQDINSWEETGVMYLHSGKVFSDYLKACLSSDTSHKATQVFSRHQYSIVDFQTAFGMLADQGIEVELNTVVFIHSSSKPVKTADIQIGSQKVKVSFNSKGVCKTKALNDITNTNINVLGVNLIGCVSA